MSEQRKGEQLLECSQHKSPVKAGGTCACRKTERGTLVKKALDARLARIEGQVRGLRRMIEEDVYCDDVLAQVAAAQAALGKASLVILEHHMKHCLIDRVQAGETDIVDELIETIGRMV
ncbi:MAG TPA: metal-sensing transcriptional repressor [Spirochaetales bacterium]|nr:metal-sensing transcriptional repressor [Spirochaetales bacterium]